jgi:hypothetical protein
LLLEFEQMRSFLFLTQLLPVLVLLSSCGECLPNQEHHVYTDIGISLFNNEDGENIYPDSGNTNKFPANNLGISVKYLDSLLYYEKNSSGTCFTKKLRIRQVLHNPPQELHVYSTFQFMTKKPGEDLKEYFLISGNRNFFPNDLKFVDFREYGKADFVLLLKTYIEHETVSEQKFIVEVHLDNKILRDTTITVVLQ